MKLWTFFAVIIQASRYIVQLGDHSPTLLMKDHPSLRSLGPMYKLNSFHLFHSDQDISEVDLTELKRKVKWIKKSETRKRYRRNEFPDFNDPLFADQWHLLNRKDTGVDINVKEVWRQGITGKGVVVAIVDDGVDFLHPDISQNYVRSS